MINGKTVLAIVPARGGSKRLPRKNLLPLHGKPLIVWTIESGLKSKYVDRLIVSSDDPEILAVAKHSRAETIERPAALASQTSSGAWVSFASMNADTGINEAMPLHVWSPFWNSPAKVVIINSSTA